MAERVECGRLAEGGLLDGTAEGSLDDRFVPVVAMLNTRLTAMIPASDASSSRAPPITAPLQGFRIIFSRYPGLRRRGAAWAWAIVSPPPRGLRRTIALPDASELASGEVHHLPKRIAPSRLDAPRLVRGEAHLIPSPLARISHNTGETRSILF